MKVLFFIDTLEVGGAEQSLLSMLSRLRDTTSVMCHVYPGDALRERYETAGIDVVGLGVRGRYGFVGGVRKALDVIDDVRPDVVHATLYRAGMIARAACRLRRVPLVDSFVNDSYAALRYKYLSSTGRMKLRVVQQSDALTADWVTRFVSITNAIRESNCRALGIDPARVEVIYRGRDPAPFVAGRARRAATRAQLGLAPEQPVILNVARLLRRKGQMELVRAMPAILARVPDAQLLIAGEGPARGDIEALIAHLGLEQRVRLLGTRHDVPDLLGAADVFAFPSHFEGLGGALIEAMFARCPIVAADTPVHRELVRHGQTGLLFGVEDAAALARQVSAAFEDRVLAARLAVAAEEQALARFDLDRVAHQYEALYARLARHGAAA